VPAGSLPKEYTVAEVADLIGLVPPFLRPGLARELARFLETTPAEADDLIAQALSDPRSASSGADAAATLAWEAARLIRNGTHLEAIRVMISVVGHYSKRTALAYLGGVGDEAIAMARTGLSVTHLEQPGPRLEFSRWRFDARSLDIAMLSAASALAGRFDLIASYGPAAGELDPALILAEAVCRLEENGLIFAEPGGTIDAAQTHYPGALVKAGLRRAIDCGHTVVYVKDTPAYDAIPLEQQIGEMAAVLRASPVVSATQERPGRQAA
jgi:hypothetical protein